MQLFRSNAVARPIDGCLRIKKEEYSESDTDDEEQIKTEDIESRKENAADRAELIADLMKLRVAYNNIFFELQKEKEKSDAEMREQKRIADVLNKKEMELRAQQKETQLLATKLGKLRSDLDYANKQQAIYKEELVGLRSDNKLLQARTSQLQFGINARRNFETQQHNNLTKEISFAKNSEFEVENILQDEFRRRKQYFLVKWRGYDDTENSWVSKHNLNCPKILKKYLHSKKTL